MMSITNKIQKLKSKSRLGQLVPAGPFQLGSVTSGTGLSQVVPSLASPVVQTVPSPQPVIVASNQTYNTFNLAEDVVNNVLIVDRQNV